MSEKATLKAEVRTTKGSRAMRKLRAEARIPAIVYGHGETPLPISVCETEFRTLLRHGAHGLIPMQISGKAEQVVIKDLQYDALGTDIFHVDFARVSADERITITVPVVLKGDAPGQKAGGVLDHQMHEIEIECLASALLEQVIVNISSLQLGGTIHVSDITLPAGVRAISDADGVVVHIVKARDESELEVTEPGVAEPEVIKREVKEEDADA